MENQIMLISVVVAAIFILGIGALNNEGDLAGQAMKYRQELVDPGFDGSGGGMVQGTLSIATQPNANIRIDGVAQGTTPKSLKVDPGQHTIEFSLDGGYATATKYATVTSAETTYVYHVMIPEHCGDTDGGVVAGTPGAVYLSTEEYGKWDQCRRTDNTLYELSCNPLNNTIVNTTIVCPYGCTVPSPDRIILPLFEV